MIHLCAIHRASGGEESFNEYRRSNLQHGQRLLRSAFNYKKDMHWNTYDTISDGKVFSELVFDTLKNKVVLLTNRI